MHITIWDWITSLFEDTRKKEVEDYLAQSMNHYDLEQRIKTLTRRGVM